MDITNKRFIDKYLDKLELEFGIVQLENKLQLNKFYSFLIEDGYAQIADELVNNLIETKNKKLFRKLKEEEPTEDKPEEKPAADDSGGNDGGGEKKDGDGGGLGDFLSGDPKGDNMSGEKEKTLFDTPAGLKYMRELPKNDPVGKRESIDNIINRILEETINEANYLKSKYKPGHKIQFKGTRPPVWAPNIKQGDLLTIVEDDPTLNTFGSGKYVKTLELPDGTLVRVASNSEGGGISSSFKHQGGIWNERTLETAASTGLFVDGIDLLDKLNSAKSTDRLPEIVTDIKSEIKKALGSSGEYKEAQFFLNKLDTISLPDLVLFVQLMAGMTKFKNNVLNFTPLLIHKSVDSYKKAINRPDMIIGVKDNTSDILISNVPVNELVSAIESNKPIEFDSKGICTITGTNVKFIQISLKKGEGKAQLGKVYQYLKSKFNLPSVEDLLDIPINEDLIDYLSRGVDFIKNVGSKFVEKLKEIKVNILNLSKKIQSLFSQSPVDELKKLEKELKQAGLTGSISESKLNEAKIIDVLDQISNDKKLLDILINNTNMKISNLKQLSDKYKASELVGYTQLNSNVSVTAEEVGKILSNFQSAVVLNSLLKDTANDGNLLYSEFKNLEDEMIYGKTNLPIYKVYGIEKNTGVSHKLYPGRDFEIKEPVENAEDVVVIYIQTTKQKTYLTFSSFILSGILKDGELNYVKYRMGTNASGRYSYVFEGVNDLPHSSVKKTLGIS